MNRENKNPLGDIVNSEGPFWTGTKIGLSLMGVAAITIADRCLRPIYDFYQNSKHRAYNLLDIRDEKWPEKDEVRYNNLRNWGYKRVKDKQH